MESSPRPAENPTYVLSRTQLTLALVLVTLLPFSLVVILYTTQPDVRDPLLLANVTIEPRAWTATDGSGSTRLLPCAIVQNPTNEVWRNLNLSINKQFHFFHPKPVEPGTEVAVPLKFFHTKGNSFFPPDSQKLKLLTVYAQIPSGARAILEVNSAELDFEQPGLQK